MKVIKVLYNILEYILLGLLSPIILIKRYIDNNTKDKVYKYIALSNNKKEIGYIKVNDKNIIEKLLIMENKELISLSTNKYLSYKYRNIKLNEKQLIFFLVQLTTYMRFCDNLIESINLVIKRTRDIDLNNKLRLVRYYLMSGNSLSESLDKLGCFPKLLIIVLKDHEDIDTLEEIRDYYKDLYINKKQEKKLNLHKIFVIPYTLTVLTFVISYSIPQIYKLFMELFRVKIYFLKYALYLYGYTRLLMLIVIMSLSTILVVRLLYLFKLTRKRIQSRLMELPLINKSIIYYQMIIYFKTITLLIKYDIKDREVFNNITTNINYQELILDTVKEYKNEKVISHLLNDFKYMDKKAYQMILTGEKFDCLFIQINNVVNYYQDIVNNNYKKNIKILSPIFLMSSIILFSSILTVILFISLVLIEGEICYIIVLVYL